MKNAVLIFSSFVVFGQDAFQPNVLSDQLAALDKEASLVYVQPMADGINIDFSNFHDESEIGEGSFEFSFFEGEKEIVISAVNAKEISGKQWFISNKQIGSALAQNGIRNKMGKAVWQYGFGWLLYNVAAYENPNEPGDGLIITVRSRLFCVDENCIMINPISDSQIGDSHQFDFCGFCQNVGSFNSEWKSLEETGYISRSSVHADEVITPNHEGGFGLAYTRVY